MGTFPVAPALVGAPTRGLSTVTLSMPSLLGASAESRAPTPIGVDGLAGARGESTMHLADCIIGDLVAPPHTSVADSHGCQASDVEAGKWHLSPRAFPLPWPSGEDLWFPDPLGVRECKPMRLLRLGRSRLPPEWGLSAAGDAATASDRPRPVSYTHLTLPTILRV